MEIKRIVIALLTCLIVMLSGLIYHNGDYNYLKEVLLNGFGITIIITLFSVIFGTVLGGIIGKLRTSADRIFNLPSKLFIQILISLVLLFAVYCAIFMKISWVFILIEICVFTFYFALYSSEILKNGIYIVDKGQIEAAEATGFNNFQIFKLIILPQILKNILPAYKNLTNNIFKIISVIGYIAILDFTNNNKIFGTVLLTAIIYFVIVFILIELIEYCILKVYLKFNKSAEVNDADN